jgi:hypothetical protein
MNIAQSISGRECLTYFAGALRIMDWGIIVWAQRNDASLLPCCECRERAGGKVPFGHPFRFAGSGGVAQVVRATVS